MQSGRILHPCPPRRNPKPAESEGSATWDNHLVRVGRWLSRDAPVMSESTLRWEQAVRRGDPDDVDRLLLEGADVDALDRHGQSALMRAAVLGHVAVVERLIAGGAELNHTAKYRLSALMLAVINGHVSIAGMLVDAGADVSLQASGAPGFAQKTAADFARERGYEQTAALIEAAGRGTDT